MEKINLISVILEEYKGLRQEITARTGYGFQTVGLGFVAFSFLAGRNHADYIFWIAAIAGTIAIALATMFNLRDISKAGRRIKEIELDVNSRAGEDLLIWENICGPGATGYLVWNTGFRHRIELSKMVPPERTKLGQPLV